MAITTHDGWVAAQKQRVNWMKTGTRTLIAAMPYTVFDIAGNPGAGTLSAGNTANGLVPTDATTGYPAINSFGGSYGYIGKIDYGSSVPCCFDLNDRLFVCGAYAYNANTTLASQPSYAGRVLNSNYNGLSIWVEAVTAFTGNPSFQINYLDQDGNAGDTGVVASGVAMAVGRMMQIPLAAGDSGVQQITQVRCTVATVGTFNVMVLRPLWFGRVMTANGGDAHSYLKTGLPQIFDTSALYMILYADSTAVGLPDISIQLAIG